MAYVPDGDSYWKWYAGYTSSPSWHFETVVGAEANALRQLIKHEGSSITSKPPVTIEWE